MSKTSRINVEDMTPEVLDYAVAMFRGEVKSYPSKKGPVWPMFHKMHPFILEGEKISTVNMGGYWLAWTPKYTQANGPTLMIAGLRCYVIENLGRRVDIPDEVLQCIAP